MSTATKTTKATKATKPVKASAVKPVVSADPVREAAKEAGLTLTHYRIVKLIQANGPQTYREIADAGACSYPGLTATMRAEYEGSLCTLGYAKETTSESANGRTAIAFDLTVKGTKVAGINPYAKKGKGK